MDKVKVDPVTGCWIWQAAKDRRGYGVYMLSRTGLPPGVSRRVAAHRYSYEAAVAPIPTGLVMDHLCRNPPCVNPEHLEPVTNAENSRRGAGLGGALWDGRPVRNPLREREFCKQGHRFTPENTYFDPKGSNHRRCAECRRIQERQRRIPKRDPQRCRNGHDRSETYIQNDGRKICRICSREAQRRYNRRKSGKG